MHLKLQIAIDLPTHRVARDVLVPEFYTLHELHLILQSSLGWSSDMDYCFRSEEFCWMHSTIYHYENLEAGQFLAEGTTLSEVHRFWNDDGASYEPTLKKGLATSWQFSIKILTIVDSHPDITVAHLVDGCGDMPSPDSNLQKMFLEEAFELAAASGEGAKLKTRQFSKIKSRRMSEKTIGLCAEKVISQSLEIARARREGRHL